MCVGIPMRIVSVDRLAALCEAPSGRVETRDAALVGPPPEGACVLGFRGAAGEVLAPERARPTGRALAGIRDVFTAEGLGGAFADLEAREPAQAHADAKARAAADAGATQADGAAT